MKKKPTAAKLEEIESMKDRIAALEKTVRALKIAHLKSRVEVLQKKVVVDENAPLQRQPKDLPTHYIARPLDEEDAHKLYDLFQGAVGSLLATVQIHPVHAGTVEIVWGFESFPLPSPPTP